MEALTDFLFMGSKITEDGDCNHEIRRQLLLGRKVMTDLSSVLKTRVITLPTKLHTVKGVSKVNEADVDVFLEFPCFFYDPTDVGNLISGPSAFSKSSLNIWKFLVMYC